VGTSIAELRPKIEGTVLKEGRAPSMMFSKSIPTFGSCCVDVDYKAREPRSVMPLQNRFMTMPILASEQIICTVFESLSKDQCVQIVW
jgi:hypothetical protein